MGLARGKIRMDIAGPTPKLLHRLLWLAAGLVKFRILPSLVPLAPVMNWVVNTVRWGEHRGGMIVEVTGQSTAGKVKRSWHLLAEGDGGPLIPSMAAEAVIRNCLAGKFPVRGARSGHRDLELEDYAPLLARHGIKTGLREEHEMSRQLPIYERILGEAYFRLARPLQKFHSRSSAFAMKGKADVVRDRSLASKLVGRLIGFPEPGQNVDVEVTIDIDGQVETWTRKFERRVFQSRQKLGRGRYDGLIVESFGPIGFGIAVTENDGRLGLALRGWDILGLPMPRWAMPDGQAFEHGADGRFNFEVEIKLPVVGLIVGYKGWLKPVT